MNVTKPLTHTECLPASLTCLDKNHAKSFAAEKAGIHKITASVWYSCDPLTTMELSDISTDVTRSFFEYPNQFLALIF